MTCWNKYSYRAVRKSFYGKGVIFMLNSQFHLKSHNYIFVYICLYDYIQYIKHIVAIKLCTYKFLAKILIATCALNSLCASSHTALHK